MEQPFLNILQIKMGGGGYSPCPRPTSLRCPRGWQASQALCPVMRCNYPQVGPNWRLTSGPLGKFFGPFCLRSKISELALGWGLPKGF